MTVTMSVSYFTMSYNGSGVPTGITGKYRMCEVEVWEGGVESNEWSLMIIQREKILKK